MVFGTRPSCGIGEAWRQGMARVQRRERDVARAGTTAFNSAIGGCRVDIVGRRTAPIAPNHTVDQNTAGRTTAFVVHNIAVGQEGVIIIIKSVRTRIVGDDAVGQPRVT